MTCREVSLTEEQVFQFNQDGFLIIENLIDEEMVGRLRARFEPLFAGEYVRGSHKWPLVEKPGDFHAPTGGYRLTMERAAAAVGVTAPEIVHVEVSAGSCVLHHGNTWHGSGRNLRPDKVRRSIGVHTLSSETRFRSSGAGYIYGRYKRAGDISMDESFFPILWARNGYRSPHIGE